MFKSLLDTTSSYTSDDNKKGITSYGEVPCQNCGVMTLVTLPFVGCVFCGDCNTNDSGQNDGTEDFYDRRREYWPFFDKPVKRKYSWFGKNISNAISSIKGTNG